MTQSMWLFRFALPEGKTLGWKEVERHVAWPLLGDCELSIIAEFFPVSHNPGSVENGYYSNSSHLSFNYLDER